MRKKHQQNEEIILLTAPFAYFQIKMPRRDYAYISTKTIHYTSLSSLSKDVKCWDFRESSERLVIRNAILEAGSIWVTLWKISNISQYNISDAVIDDMIVHSYVDIVRGPTILPKFKSLLRSIVNPADLSFLMSSTITPLQHCRPLTTFSMLEQLAEVCSVPVEFVTPGKSYIIQTC